MDESAASDDKNDPLRPGKEGDVVNAQTLGQLCAQVAHDFNNVLAVALTSVEMAMRIGDPEKANMFLGNALRVIARGRTLTDNLSAASYACELPVAIDAHALISRLRAADGTLAVELGAARSVVRSDPRFLEEALRNLIGNARNAMSSGGTPMVSTRNAQGSELRAEANREYLVIAVHDTGEGMSEAMRNQAFELFFSAKPTGKSRGIGLAQAKDTARRAGGVASIESRVGEGSIVTLAIPLADTA